MKEAIDVVDRLDAGRMHKQRSDSFRLPHERIENRACGIGDGKQFARVFPFEFHARVSEERYGVVSGEPPEHLADSRWRAAGEVGFVDLTVRDVAAAAAGDEDLGTKFFGSVDRHDRERPAEITGGAARPRGGEEAGGPGADDENVTGGGAGRHAWRTGFSLSYFCVKANTPRLLATTMSGRPSAFKSATVTCVPTPLSSSTRWGTNVAPPLPSRSRRNQ